MASAGSVRAGGAYIEIFAKDGAFQQAMTRVQNKLAAVGASMRRIGTQMSIGGAALGAPLLLAARQAAGFEDALLGMKAAAGLSAAEVAKLEAESIKLSKSMGIDPTRIANAFLELTKAGMSVQEVLDGAGRSAVEFSKVSGVELQQAAVFMKTAMNTFGISATEAVDTLSAAADASETSIAAMVESFGLVGSAGVTFNQTIFDISQGLAALAKFGIQGEEAGTGIKTLLSRLVAPSKEARDALALLGLSVESFRDADGKLLPLAQIAEIFQQRLAGMDDTARGLILSQQALVDVFGDRGIKVISAFVAVGSEGFESIAKAMESNLPVSAKFEIMMSGISGAFEKLYAAAQRLAIAFAKSLGDALGTVTNGIVFLMDAFAALITQFPVIGKLAAGLALGLVAVGSALIAVGFAAIGLSAAFGVIGPVLRGILTPAGLIVIALVGGITLAIMAARQLSPAFEKEFGAIMAALGRLDFSTAWQIMNLNFAIALMQMAQKADSILRQIGGFFTAAGQFIGDGLIEGLDRFMGLFGADIITLQSSLQKLGVYLRAAFDWGFATTGMQAALDAIDSEAERARQRAPTADSRAEDRAAQDQANADARAAANRKAEEGWQGAIDQARAELDGLHADSANAAADAEKKSKVKRSEFRDQMEGGVPAGAAGAGAGIGATLGTFGNGAGIGIGPELNKLEDPAVQTAKNTGIAADALVQIAQADGAMGGGAAANAGAVGGIADAAVNARAGMNGVVDLTAVAKTLDNGFAAMVAAIREHIAVSQSHSSQLDKIIANTGKPGAAFV
jgi:TP901 family phage tail tape measure protein